MGLRLKFNLVLFGVFALGLAVSGTISYQLLHKNAREEVRERRTAAALVDGGDVPAGDVGEGVNIKMLEDLK